MKTFKSSAMSLLAGLCCICLSVPVLDSCTDADALWSEIDEIKSRLDNLEKDLNDQIQAFNELMENGDLTIKSFEKNANTGSYIVTLSNGTTFSVLPAGVSAKGIITYKEVDGVKYWATYDVNGKVTLLQSAGGDYYPVESVVPTVEEKDGKYFLIVGDEEFETGFSPESSLAVFTGYELNKDDTGNVYSVTLKLGNENMTITLPMDGYQGFTFKIGSADSYKMVKEYYVDYASTGKLVAGMDGVVDYVLQVPDGWKVREDVDELMGLTYLLITAPEKAAVEAGNAVAEGDLKVIAVIEGGKAMAARLHLTAEPFRRFTATSTNAIIEVYPGLDKFLYGLCEYPADVDAIFAGADAMLQANDKGVSNKDINMSLSELLGAELDTEKRYVLWAVPVFYDYDEEDGYYYVKDGLIKMYDFGSVSVDVKTTKVAFNDADITVKIAGTDAFYGGTSLYSETFVSETLRLINMGVLEPYTEPLTYEGSAFEFPSPEANSGVQPKVKSRYVTWIVPKLEGRDEYIAEDVMYVDYTLPDVQAGGTLEVTAGDAVVDKVSISVPLSSEGAAGMYYVFLDARSAGKLTTDQKVTDYLYSYGKYVSGSEVTVIDEKVKPGTERVLMAMAVDQDGKYGTKPLKLSKTTDAVVYNDLSVTLTKVNVEATKAAYQVSVTGGEASGYLWWYGKTSDIFWTSDDYCDKSETVGQEYMACYPDDSEIVRRMNISTLENGTLQMKDLALETEYVLLMMAKDAEGNYSVAAKALFKTLAANLGEVVVTGSDAWNTAKESIEIKWRDNMFRKAANSEMMAFYAFDIKIPSDLTAYIYCISEDYFTDLKEEGKIRSVADQIILIEKDCSRKYDAGKVLVGPDGEYVNEPDWVDDSGEVHGGTLMNVYDFYVHGYPTNGFATYFASGSHGAGNCISWEDGACQNYAEAQKSIENMCSLDYWKKYVKTNRGSTCKIESVINKAAQDLLDAYKPHYENDEPLIFINNGDALYMEQHYASGPDDDGNVADDVIVVLKDLQGNYYEPMVFPVPDYFK